MQKNTFTLIYQRDNEWYVGELLEVPGVYSQGHTVEELKENILDAYQLLLKERRSHSRRKNAVKRIPVSV